MKITNASRSLLFFAATLAFSLLFVPPLTHAQAISKTSTAGPYSVTLKVLPAESFRGPQAAMHRDGGAQPNYLNGAARPNHHLVAFVTTDGRPVENAAVSIAYRRLAAGGNAWQTLPVVRMHVTGKSLATTHYGNNVALPPGRYQVRVTVDGSGPAFFRFILPAR